MLNYFSRYKTLPAFFEQKPNDNVGIIVVIPCYDDDFVFQTLENINVTNKPNCAVEVIVVVNSGENTEIDIVNKNQITLKNLINISESNNYYFKILPILIENVPKKFAGVGNARKTGMDEAVRRFTQIENVNGVIVSLDSDCRIGKNYFTEIEKYFINNSKSECCTINFQHDFDKNLYLEKEIVACRLYEIYLRYFRLCLAATGFPFCFHTIGSCFAVKALCYCKSGGMARLQAGEDFYFLHKAAQNTKIGRIDAKLVFPAPRISDRVPFGTGKTIRKIIENQHYKVYNFELFMLLKNFFAFFDNIFDSKNIDLEFIPKEIINFLSEEKLTAIFQETILNTKRKEQFIKRLYSKFDAFFIIKFLNSFNNSKDFPPIDLFEAIKKLLDYYKISTDNFTIENIYEIIYDLDMKN